MIVGGEIRGGSITSDTEIDVGTNAYIGRELILSPSHWSGIRWGEGSGVPAVWHDSAGGSLNITNPSGSIYAGNQRIDVPPVAVFG